MPDTHLALFGNGCFWCTEAVFRRLAGVKRVRPGYAGGQLKQPSYERVCAGGTGHIEVIELEFDPAVIDYATLLDVFFATHDPTSLDRQGHDIGQQYRSVIFALDEKQAQTAAAKIAELEQAAIFENPIVTELRGPAHFWPAETYHDNYYEQHPEQGYCQVVIAPKLSQLRQRFSNLLADDESK